MESLSSKCPRWMVDNESSTTSLYTLLPNNFEDNKNILPVCDEHLLFSAVNKRHSGICLIVTITLFALKIPNKFSGSKIFITETPTLSPSNCSHKCQTEIFLNLIQSWEALEHQRTAVVRRQIQVCNNSQNKQSTLWVLIELLLHDVLVLAMHLTHFLKPLLIYF